MSSAEERKKAKEAYLAALEEQKKLANGNSQALSSGSASTIASSASASTQKQEQTTRDKMLEERRQQFLSRQKGQNSNSQSDPSSSGSNSSNFGGPKPTNAGQGNIFDGHTENNVGPPSKNKLGEQNFFDSLEKNYRSEHSNVPKMKLAPTDNASENRSYVDSISFEPQPLHARSHQPPPAEIGNNRFGIEHVDRNGHHTHTPQEGFGGHQIGALNGNLSTPRQGGGFGFGVGMNSQQHHHPSGAMGGFRPEPGPNVANVGFGAQQGDQSAVNINREGGILTIGVSDGKEVKRQKQELYAMELKAQMNEKSSLRDVNAINHQHQQANYPHQINIQQSNNAQVPVVDEKRLRQQEYARQLEQEERLRIQLQQQSESKARGNFVSQAQSNFPANESKDAKRQKQAEYARELEAQIQMKSNIKPEVRSHPNYSQQPQILYQQYPQDRGQQMPQNLYQSPSAPQHYHQVPPHGQPPTFGPPSGFVGHQPINAAQPFADMNSNRANSNNNNSNVGLGIGIGKAPEDEKAAKRAKQAEYARYLEEQQRQQQARKGHSSDRAGSQTQGHGNSNLLEEGWVMGPLGVPVRKTLEVGNRATQKAYVQAISSPKKQMQTPSHSVGYPGNSSSDYFSRLPNDMMNPYSNGQPNNYDPNDNYNHFPDRNSLFQQQQQQQQHVHMQMPMTGHPSDVRMANSMLPVPSDAYYSNSYQGANAVTNAGPNYAIGPAGPGMGLGFGGPGIGLSVGPGIGPHVGPMAAGPGPGVGGGVLPVPAGSGIGGFASEDDRVAAAKMKQRQHAAELAFQIQQDKLRKEQEEKELKAKEEEEERKIEAARQKIAADFEKEQAQKRDAEVKRTLEQQIEAKRIQKEAEDKKEKELEAKERQRLEAERESIRRREEEELQRERGLKVAPQVAAAPAAAAAAAAAAPMPPSRGRNPRDREANSAGNTANANASANAIAATSPPIRKPQSQSQSQSAASNNNRMDLFARSPVPSSSVAEERHPQQQQQQQQQRYESDAQSRNNHLFAAAGSSDDYNNNNNIGYFNRVNNAYDADGNGDQHVKPKGAAMQMNDDAFSRPLRHVPFDSNPSAASVGTERRGDREDDVQQRRAASAARRRRLLTSNNNSNNNGSNDDENHANAVSPRADKLLLSEVEKISNAMKQETSETRRELSELRQSVLELAKAATQQQKLSVVPKDRFATESRDGERPASREIRARKPNGLNMNSEKTGNFNEHVAVNAMFAAEQKQQKQQSSRPVRVDSWLNQDPTGTITPPRSPFRQQQQQQQQRRPSSRSIGAKETQNQRRPSVLEQEEDAIDRWSNSNNNNNLTVMNKVASSGQLNRAPRPSSGLDQSLRSESRFVYPDGRTVIPLATGRRDSDTAQSSKLQPLQQPRQQSGRLQVSPPASPAPPPQQSPILLLPSPQRSHLQLTSTFEIVDNHLPVIEELRTSVGSEDQSTTVSDFDAEALLRKNRRRLQLLQMCADEPEDRADSLHDLVSELNTVSSQPSSRGSTRPSSTQVASAPVGSVNSSSVAVLNRGRIQSVQQQQRPTAVSSRTLQSCGEEVASRPNSRSSVYSSQSSRPAWDSFSDYGL